MKNEFIYLKSISSNSNDYIQIDITLANEIVPTSEFIDNYITKDSSPWKTWPDNLQDIFPYSHFYKGLSRILLDFHEKYSLNFGIENRHIFYDKKFVQCWLNTTPEIKNKESKGFLKDYLRRYNIPISNFPKTGFYKQNMGHWSKSIRIKKNFKNDHTYETFYSKTIFLGEKG